MKSVVAFVAVALLVLTGSPPADALPILQFSCISNNSAADCTIAQAQITVDVTDPAGPNNVLFTFLNSGPSASSIADVYFDDGTLVSFSGFVEGPGVDFGVGASPGNLPAGNNAVPAFDATFAFDSEPPVQPNGVNPGEFLSIGFNLGAGQGVDDVIDALNTGALRIGVHIQGFASGGSESLINLPPSETGPQETVPAPMGLILLGAGLIAVRVVSRARRR